MRISKEKLDSLKSRARNVGRKFASGGKGSAVEAVTGVVAYYAHKMAAERISFVSGNWWAGPITLGVAGHLLKKKQKTAGIGAALLGAAGYAGGMGYAMNKGAVTTTETKGLLSPEDVRGFEYPSQPYALPDTGPMDLAPSEWDEADVSAAAGLY